MGVDTETSKVDQTVDAVKKSLTGLTGSIATTASTFMMTKPSITSAISGFGKLGKSVGAITGVVEAQVAQYQALTKSGMNFGGNLAQLTLSSTAAGLSVKEMTKLVTSNSESLAGFGSTADDGMTSFLSNLAAMNTQGNRYGIQLRNIGLTHEEIGETMIMTQRRAMMSGLKEEASSGSIMAATAAYAKDLDLLSKLTGKSNDALKKQQEGFQREGRYKAAMLGMGTKTQSAVDQMLTIADANGLGTLYKDMMTAGVPIGKASQIAAATHGESYDLIQKMVKLKNAGLHKELKALAPQLEAAAAKERVSNAEIAKYAGLNSTLSHLGDVFANTSTRGMALSAKIKQGMTMQEALASVQAERDKATTEGRGQGSEDIKGSPIPKERMVLNGVLRAQESVIAGAVEVQAKLTTKLYTETIGPMLNNITTDSGILSDALGLASDGLKTLSKLLPSNTSVTTRDIDPSRAAGKEVIKKLEAFQTSQGANAPDADKKARANTIKTNIDNAQTDEERLKFIKQANTLLQIVTQTIPNNNNKAPTSGIPFLRGGTPGIDSAVSGLNSFASITQDFGKESLALLHGNELVMTKAQAAQLDAGILAMSSTLSISLASMKESLSKNFQKSNFDELQLDRGMPKQDESSLINMKKNQRPTEQRFASAPVSASGGQNFQGAINTIRSRDNSPMGNDNSGLEEMFKQMITGELIPSLNTLKASLPSEDILGSLLDTSKQQLGSTMQQIAKLESGNKLTKRLSKAGNAFGGVLS